IGADLALGEASGLIGELRELTAADPLAERPRALLMRALAAAGRQADALAVYAQARELLADRLGVDPSPQLEEVYLAVLRQEVPRQPPVAAAAPSLYPERTAAAAPAPAPAPAGAGRLSGGQRPPTSFVGRDDDVRGVLKKLAEERLVTLTGPGGVGKTRLAAEAAARQGAPAWFAELAPVSEPAEVPYAVLDALGLRERVIARHGADAGAADPVDRLCDALAGRDAVLVLDNCEHVIEVAARLAGRVLAGCARVRILATSREPLRIDGETLWVVSPLAVPPVPPGSAADAADPGAPGAPDALAPAAPAVPGAPRAEAGDISLYPAVRLFRDRAAAVLPSFAVDAGNAPAVARICRALDGMPLAIELAAVWSRTLTPAQLAERLDDRFALLTGGSRTALPRHQTLRAVVEWSWNLLSEPERVLARRLAVFPGGATLAAAEQVCAGSGLSGAAVLPALSGLVGKSILTVADGAGASGSRYRMLETVRAYGLEQLAAAGEETAVRDAFAACYLGFAEAADPLLRTAEQARWFRELTAEQDNMYAALRWAIGRGDAPGALRFVRALGYYWIQRGRGEGDTLAREVLQLPPPAESLLIAEARVVCAVMSISASLEIDAVREPLAEALASMHRCAAGSAAIHPIAAMGESMVAIYDGDAAGALALIGGYTTADDPWLRAAARMFRSAYTAMFGQLDGVEADCAAALAEFRSIGDAWGVAMSLMQLAEFAELRADHAAAVAALEEAEQIGRTLDAWGDMAYIAGMLAVARARAGDIDRADDDLRRGERSAAGHAAVLASEWFHLTRAELAWRAGDLPAAARSCELALASLKNRQARWWLSLRSQVETRLALVVLEEGDTARCRELLAAALPAARDWVELPPLAALIDAAAALALHGRRAAGADPGAGADLAATLLGAAHSIRGAFDESSLAAPRVRAAARRALGEPGFDAAYSRGRELSRDQALELTARTISAG
ncbi:BTAD domain-containing putative transcriptional regulator, partial [Trebonia sp.]|uniref:ATP-binding protein n=1 Tax=Trebonia sp. TaxID=2767075 RepID=UPI0026119706